MVLDNKTSGPIRFALVIANVGYFLTGIAFLLMVGLCIHFLFGGIPSGWDFTFSFPISFDLQETVVLDWAGQMQELQLKAVGGKVTLVDPPRALIWLPSGLLLVMLALIFVAINHFRKFLKPLSEGDFFNQEAIRRLRFTALFVAIAWFVQTTTVFWASLWMGNHFTYQGKQLTVGSDVNWGMIGFAIFLWILSRIFDHGRQLEEEQKLTI